MSRKTYAMINMLKIKTFTNLPVNQGSDYIYVSVMLCQSYY